MKHTLFATPLLGQTPRTHSFVTADHGLRRQISRICEIQKTDSFRPLLVTGECGTGKMTLSRFLWSQLATPNRPRQVVHDRGNRNLRSLVHAAEICRGGDLVITSTGRRSIDSLRVLRSVIQGYPDVRVIQIARNSTVAPDGDGLPRVATVTIPPLRARRGDIRILTRYFLERTPNVGILEPSMRALENSSWPFNTKQLREVVDGLARACEMEGLSCITPDLTRRALSLSWHGWTVFATQRAVQDSALLSIAENFGLRKACNLVEARLIARALYESGGNLSIAANRLRIPISTLGSKIKNQRSDVAEFQRWMASTSRP